MIEKLDILKHTDNLYGKDGFIANVPHGKDVIIKINELVDAVNVLQAQVAILEEHAHPTAKVEPVDKFAEQRKWIGKLCKFQDIGDDEYLYEILTAIDDRDGYPYKAGDISFSICEPVSEDLIYKGE